MSKYYWNYFGTETDLKERWFQRNRWDNRYELICLYQKKGIPIPQGDIRIQMEKERGAGVIVNLEKYERAWFVFANRWQFLEQGCLEEAITNAYTLDEYPLYHMNASMWQMLFDQCDAERLYSIDREAPIIDGSTTLYRACYPLHKRGISWTASLETAQFFQQRKFTPGKASGEKFIYTTKAPKEAIAFYTNDRKEQEFVLHPRFTKTAYIPRLKEVV